ncbi:DNA adenine methylase [Campylobacter sp. RM12651]|uniref:DNA adenine methylase n=1 Tax=Campylobacter sp. RM12651 TaxID=1660079 RepID=UPI001EFBD1DA|nr:DNA adenine methylase [Campylobacter sp. RM12651]ULO03783.1 type II adenine-specific DNA methyltransferase [Campylobacter sp. RM12651]
MSENKAYLSEQIITYLGNKRSLLDFIAMGVEYAKIELKKDKLSSVDLFSGSGIVARFLKQHSSYLIANDLESYSKAINECYLLNINDDFYKELLNEYNILSQEIINNLDNAGFIKELYSPKDELNISPNDRVFYTNYNASYIDTARKLLEHNKYKKYFLAPLLYEASVKVNTSGVFKGFYKNKNGIGQFGGEGQNALSRIKANINLQMPVFSAYNVPFEVFKMDANNLAKELDCDLCYIDPPYNQHPYGSNYFMLNLITNYIKPSDISKVSGIAKGWNKSAYNYKATALESFTELISNLKAKIVLISYNNEGIIEENELMNMLKQFGQVQMLEQKYNTFRASRNLNNRALYVSEKLYILKNNKE